MGDLECIFEVSNEILPPVISLDGFVISRIRQDAPSDQPAAPYMTLADGSITQLVDGVDY